ncbi:hypothetical protein L6452_00694 [Arctium lappa]|uniref:Uncharacterized protein n=1 Tax=Arctium lappa TaxID=4217 RepID=A0ACB9FFF6_ARCLA|nr:hypothetical protein L6452_00694 [Arctium lappa]
MGSIFTHAFHRGKDEETEKKCGEDRPAVGRVTESRRLWSDGNVVAEKWLVDKVKDAVGSWFDDTLDPARADTHHIGHDYDEYEHHAKKKSVIKKVKEKAKKIKNTITKHGHGHGGDDHHHHDDDDEEMEQDPQDHGAPSAHQLQEQ